MTGQFRIKWLDASQKFLVGIIFIVIESTKIKVIKNHSTMYPYKESFFEYYGVIILVGAWSNPIKPQGPYHRVLVQFYQKMMKSNVWFILKKKKNEKKRRTVFTKCPKVYCSIFFKQTNITWKYDFTKNLWPLMALLQFNEITLWRERFKRLFWQKTYRQHCYSILPYPNPTTI